MIYQLYSSRTLLGRKQWRWRLKAGNNRIIANGGEAYRNKQDCRDAIDRVRGSAQVRIEETDR